MMRALYCDEYVLVSLAAPFPPSMPTVRGSQMQNPNPNRKEAKVVDWLGLGRYIIEPAIMECVVVISTGLSEPSPLFGSGRGPGNGDGD